MTGILTYNIPHRKTYDTLCLLKVSGYDDVTVFALPLHYKKTFTPLIEHRPKCSNDIPPLELCRRFGYEYSENFETLPENTKILICGAGMIAQDKIDRYRIINAHPGFLPNVRGLDALKWAILENQPIGVTTHRLSDEVDSGLLIDRRLVPVFPGDTFHSVAQRQYELEISMLVEAVEKIETATEIITPDGFPVHKRMPNEYEAQLLEAFGKI